MKKNIKFHKKKFLLLKIITLFIISIYFLSCSKKIEISNQITKEKYFSKEIKNGDILTFEWKHSFEHILWKEFYKIEKDGSFTLFSIVTEGFGAGIPAEMDCTYRYENGLIYMENIKGSNFKDFNWIHSKEHLKKISINEKKFRAVQVYEALYKRRVTSFDDMTNISKEVREKLKQDFSFYKIKMLIKQQGKNVNKYLFELEDGNKIESVLMFHDYGTSICVSSQVGCNMTCAFCESGRLKKVRNLLAYEIVQQILQIEEDINKRITHVVLMGIGEPFDNYDNVLRFVKIINCGKGIDIGSRHITISTCGVIPGIKKFMNEEGQVNLAISLHAPNNTLRSRIMPINKAYPLNELMETIKEYINKTNRRVTFEYIMLDNVNDSEENAKELALLLKGINCYVNLIPYNETENIEFKRTKEWKIMKFYDILKKNKINVTIRKEFGGSVDAACGQLRANN